MPDHPAVSICLLTWNRASVISRSIDSLLAQSFKDFELIINDDCSTDETADICREYERSDSRVRYCRNETNLMYSGNSNAAIQRSSGEFIMFAHDGDVYHRDLVQEWVGGLREFPTAGLAFCALNVMAPDGTLERTDTQTWGPLIAGHDLLRHMLQRFDSPIFGITMIRRSVLETVGDFDGRFPRITDVDMWMRILAHFDAVYVNKPLIDVMSREEGHENSSGPNWKIARQKTEIRRINIQRLLESESSEFEKYMRKYRRDRLRLYAHSVGWCIKRAQFRRAFDGIREMLSE